MMSSPIIIEEDEPLFAANISTGMTAQGLSPGCDPDSVQSHVPPSDAPLSAVKPPASPVYPPSARKRLKLVIVRNTHRVEHRIRSDQRPQRDAACRALQSFSRAHEVTPGLGADCNDRPTPKPECDSLHPLFEPNRPVYYHSSCSGTDSDGEYCDVETDSRKRKRRFKRKTQHDPATETRNMNERMLDKDDLRLIDRAAKGLPFWEERPRYKRRRQLDGLSMAEAKELFQLIGNCMNWEIASSRLKSDGCVGGRASRTRDPAYLKKYWAETLSKIVVDMHS